MRPAGLCHNKRARASKLLAGSAALDEHCSDTVLEIALACSLTRTRAIINDFGAVG